MRVAIEVGKNIACRAGGVLALVLVLAACAVGPLGVVSRARPSPTITTAPPAPVTVTITPHTIPMGGYKPLLAIPGPAGLVLYPSGPTSFAGLPSLAFYRYSDEQVQRIATAPMEPDGSPGGIIDAGYGGAWVTYVTEDSQQTNWVLWAYNVSSGQRMQLDSQSREGQGAAWATQVNNGTDVIWAFYSGSGANKMLDSTFATNQTRLLATSTTELLKPLALSASTLLFAEVDPSGQSASTWVWTLRQASPKRVADTAGVNADVSSRYAVWDDPHTGMTVLYDLRTGALNPTFASCLRPAIADPQPYVACVQFGVDSWLLVHVPDGTEWPFDVGKATLGDGGQIYNGRVFFIGPTGNVSYFDLPAQ